jgi:RNA polymerase sigma factor (TIGR02999 family)
MPEDVTELLIAWGNGDKAALDALIPRVYKELRRLANSYLARERADHSLQATELVHEAFIRLVQWKNTSWQNRAQFFGVAAQLIRNILVDHARKHVASKRGGGMRYNLSVDNVPDLSDRLDIDLIVLDDALIKLAEVDPDQSRIIELRYFGGLTGKETAEVLGLSSVKVSREEKIAKLWLLREIEKQT